MTKLKADTPAEQTAPAPDEAAPEAERQPTEGGSYIRQDDGTLKRVKD
jgi:hypothetical protein